MNAVQRFNGLNGNVVSRSEISKIVDLAKLQEQNYVAEKLSSVLANYPGVNQFEIELEEQAIEVVPKSLIDCLDCENNTSDEEISGLGRVEPADIYQMITDKMIESIKQASGRKYKKKWKDGYVTDENGKPLSGFLIPHNFVTKKPYRGINMWLLSKLKGLQVLPMKNPFYLTFKQIESLGGKLKKGSKGKEVVYFTILYKIKNEQLDFATYDEEKFIKYLKENGISGNEIFSVLGDSKIPILKYYNVFNGEDIEGIDFDLENFKSGYVVPEKKGENERIETAELIIKKYPKPQPKLKEGNSDKAYYSPGQDYIRMPHIDGFETAQDYYRTLFHEYVHSTGSESRLGRDFSGKFGSKPYAKEELVAEFGAVFLSAQAGIIWHTNKNHAEYIKNWHNVLGIIKEDNRFLMRAASDAQRATDFILQPDKEGVPLYLKELTEKTKPTESVGVATTKKTRGAKVDKSNEVKVNLKALEKIASKDSLRPSLLGIYVAKGEYVATDGHKLVVIKADTPEEHHGKILAPSKPLKKMLSFLKDGYIDGVFPNYKSIIPAYPLKSDSINIDEILEKLKPELKKDSNTEILSQKIYFKAKHLNNVLQALKANGAKSVRFSAQHNKPMLIEADNQNFGLLMPTYMTGKNNPEFRIIEYEKLLKDGIQESIGLNTPNLRDVLFSINAPRQSEISTEMFRNMSVVELRKYTLDYYNQNLKGKTVEIKNHLKEVSFVTNAGKKIARGVMYKEKAAVIKSLETLIKNSTYNNWGNRKPTDSNDVLGYLNFKSKLTIDGKKRHVRISIVLDRQRKTKLKNFEVGAKEKSDQAKAGSQNLVPQDDIAKSLLKDKDTKISLEKTSLRNSLIIPMTSEPPKDVEFYKIPGEFGKFLGNVEIKPIDSVAITLDAPQGGGKTRFFYYMMNLLAGQGYKCLFVSLEEHPLSELAQAKKRQYIKPENQKIIDTIGELPNGYKDLEQLIPHYDIVFIDSWGKVNEIQKIDFDRSLRKKFNGKLFFVIFQRTGTGTMRGGSASQFDGDIIMKIAKNESGDYKENYAFFDKNRYQSIELDKLKFNIFNHKLIKEKKEVKPTKPKQDE